MRRPDDEEGGSSILNLMGSAGIGGSIVGAGAKALSPGLRESVGTIAKLKALGKAGLLGGAITAGLVGLGGGLGAAMMGSPTSKEIDEGSPWTKRSALGGALGGGAVGAGLGALYGSGKLGALMKLVPKGALAAGAKVTEDLPTENVIFDYLKKLGSQPSGSNALKAAALGGGSLGALSAHLGMDEGMQADVIDDERRALLKKKLGV